MEKTRMEDWHNQDIANSSLWLDLTLSEIRQRIIETIESESMEDRTLRLNGLHEYVRGLIDGNRFMKSKPKLTHHKLNDNT